MSSGGGLNTQRGTTTRLRFRYPTRNRRQKSNHTGANFAAAGLVPHGRLRQSRTGLDPQRGESEESEPVSERDGRAGGLETLRLADELNALKKRKKHKFEMQKMQKVENDYAALQIKHQLQLEEKVKVENELKDCRVEMEKLKEELIVMEKKHINEYEDIEQKHQSNSVEMLKFQNEVKLLKESSDHVIDLEDIPNSLPASEVSPRNGGLQTTDALKFSSGCSIIISDSDDDCAPGGKKQMGHKRKRDSSPNDNLEKDASSIKTAEMKQRKLGRCDSLVNYFSETVAPSAASHYGKQNKSASHTHIISGAIQKVRGTQKSCVESPAMSSKTPFDCESDDDSTSISSSDDSVDVDELQSMLSAAVEKAKS